MAHQRSHSIHRQQEEEEEACAFQDHTHEQEGILRESYAENRRTGIHNKSAHTRVFRFLESNMLHRNRKLQTRHILAIALCLSLLYYAAFVWPTVKSRTEPPQAKEDQSASAPDPRHPIERLVAENRERFSATLERQSETLEEAVQEYRRRYGRRPPRKFDRWYELARSNDLVLIDEFDVLMRNLEPFWGVNVETLRERMQSRAGAGSSYLTMNSTGMFNGSEHFQFDQIAGWFERLPWQEVVGSVEVLINVWDEPTVNVPYHIVQDALALASTQKDAGDGYSPPLDRGDPRATWRNLNKADVWDFIRDSCAAQDPAMKDPTASADYHGPMKFISNVSKSLDPCMDPYIHTHHGIFMSPMNLLLTKHLVPILSVGRPSRFNDCLLYTSPSPRDGLLSRMPSSA